MLTTSICADAPGCRGVGPTRKTRGRASGRRSDIATGDHDNGCERSPTVSDSRQTSFAAQDLSIDEMAELRRLIG